jgi:hypothetical protein
MRPRLIEQLNRGRGEVHGGLCSRRLRWDRAPGSVAHDGCAVSALGGPCRFNLDFRIHEHVFQRCTDLQEPRDAASLSAVHARDLVLGPLVEDPVNPAQFSSRSNPGTQLRLVAWIPEANIDAFRSVHTRDATSRCGEFASPHVAIS